MEGSSSKSSKLCNNYEILNKRIFLKRIWAHAEINLQKMEFNKVFAVKTENHSDTCC